jgi:hypothetical protein
VLKANWSAIVAQIGRELRPLLSNGTLLGVFVGDELVCTGVPLANFSALVKQLRAELGPKAILYANECCGTVGACDSGRKCCCWQDKIPPELDLISEDCYSTPCSIPGSYGCDNTSASKNNGWNVSWEWNRVLMHYKFDVVPKLHPGQQLMLVPGLYGFSMAGNDTDGGTEPMMSLEKQDGFLVDLLQGFWQLATNSSIASRIAGFCPWHFETRGGNSYVNASRHFDNKDLGAVAFPRTMQMLRAMGEAIRANSAGDQSPTTDAPITRLKADDDGVALAASLQPHKPIQAQIDAVHTKSAALRRKLLTDWTFEADATPSPGYYSGFAAAPIQHIIAAMFLNENATALALAQTALANPNMSSHFRATYEWTCVARAFAMFNSKSSWKTVATMRASTEESLKTMAFNYSVKNAGADKFCEGVPPSKGGGSMCTSGSENLDYGESLLYAAWHR